MEEWQPASDPPQDLHYVQGYIPDRMMPGTGHIVTVYLLNGLWRLNTMDGDPSHIVPTPSRWRELPERPRP